MKQTKLNTTKDLFGRKHSPNCGIFNSPDELEIDCNCGVYTPLIEMGRLSGYRNVQRWIQDFKSFPNIKEFNKGCGVCGGKLAIIRGRYPNTSKRKVCPTCLMEEMESIVDNLRSNIEGPKLMIEPKT